MFTIYGKPKCGLCVRLKMVLDLLGKDYEEKVLGIDYTVEDFESKFPGKNLFPQVELDGKYIGNGNETVAYLKEHRVF
jgi:glutaredoxin